MSSKHDIDPLASALEFRPGDEVLVVAKNAPRYNEVGEVYETSNDGGDLAVGVVFERGGPYASTEVYRIGELRRMTAAGEVRGSRNRQAREG